MTNPKTFIIPLRLRGLPAYVVAKAQVMGIHGFDIAIVKDINIYTKVMSFRYNNCQ